MSVEPSEGKTSKRRRMPGTWPSAIRRAPVTSAAATSETTSAATVAATLAAAGEGRLLTPSWPACASA